MSASNQKFGVKAKASGSGSAGAAAKHQTQPTAAARPITAASPTFPVAFPRPASHMQLALQQQPAANLIPRQMSQEELLAEHQRQMKAMELAPPLQMLLPPPAQLHYALDGSSASQVQAYAKQPGTQINTGSGASASASSTFFNPNVAEYTFYTLAADINNKPLSAVQLPPLNSTTFDPGFSLGPIVEKLFTEKSPALGTALAAMEGMARIISLDSKHAAHVAAKQLLSFFTCNTDLSGWKAAESFVLGLGTNNQSSALLAFYQQKSLLLLRRYCHRISWLLGLQKNVNKAFDAEFAMRVFAADKEWMNEYILFSPLVQRAIETMITIYPEQVGIFMRLPVHWPHSEEVRKAIEAAGMKVRVKSLKQDFCECMECGAQKFGWHSWDNPLSYHNYKRHPNTFQPEFRKQYGLPNSEIVSQAITTANIYPPQPPQEKMTNVAPPVRVATAATAITPMGSAAIVATVTPMRTTATAGVTTLLSNTPQAFIGNWGQSAGGMAPRMVASAANTVTTRAPMTDDDDLKHFQSMSVVKK